MSTIQQIKTWLKKHTQQTKIWLKKHAQQTKVWFATKKTTTHKKLFALTENPLIHHSHGLLYTITQLLSSTTKQPSMSSIRPAIYDQLLAFRKEINRANYDQSTQNAVIYLYCRLLNHIFTEKGWKFDDDNQNFITHFHQPEWEHNNYFYEIIQKKIDDPKKNRDFLCFCYFILTPNPMDNKSSFLLDKKEHTRIYNHLKNLIQASAHQNLYIPTLSNNARTSTFSRKICLPPIIATAIVIIGILVISISYNEKLNNAITPINETLQAISQFSDNN